MKTDDLIALLAQDTSVRQNLNHLLLHALFAAVLIAGTVFVGFIGLRPDIDSVMETGRFLFKFVVTISLAITASAVLFRIGKPGVPTSFWTKTILIPVALIALAAIIELCAVPSESWYVRMIGHNARFCLTFIPALAAGPLCCLLYALRHAAPVRPAVAGAVAGLVAAGIAATFYAANCDDDSPLFVVLWYTIAISAVALVGAIFGRVLLRW
ncbi:NrsF family protein [Phyllobacterium sp. 0TCS1.6C]|uniref:NrsF family protein n=1 Tax=unclassified Phyllobacterium TaxID=2638441 RepID=UPI0022641FB4|nr:MULTISPECIES: NrsF family protein [unclassified Phyllobacterium]MCX8279282.1 NrsF family protein [Phyllobacterium sp. 0TCS1.6C]MCX8294066.1 NrsF family protein [Phyllobacterium sp. 0TCS1.6A]